MVYLSIDTSKKQAALFLEYLKTLSFVTVYQEPNNVTKRAIDDVGKGKTKKHRNAGELVAFLNK